MYKNLLKIGTSKLNKCNGIEEHVLENKDRFNEIILLHKYVYTYYISNSSDLTQSFEFLILSEVVDDFIECLNKTKCWYIYKKSSDKTSVKNIGNNNNDTHIETLTIQNKQLSKYKIKSPTCDYGWSITKKNR
jgi:hypothetical protein